MISPELIIFVSSLGVGDNELLPAADFFTWLQQSCFYS